MNHRKYFKAGLAAAACLLLTAPTVLMAEEGPDSVEINTLSDQYEAVLFDHAMHVSAVDNKCSVCHHHTTGTGPADPRCAACHAKSGPAADVSCSGCHPRDRFAADYLKKISEDPNIHHTAKVGLKGAYHLKCMGCHQEVGAPTGCQDCHPRNSQGDKFFHAGAFAPEPSAAPKKGGHH